jgi:two-component system response regulator
MLIVEDNPADVVFFREAVEVSAVSAQLHVVDNGGDAMAFLHQQGRFATAPRPDVVVLDINVPVKNGSEVLQDMKTDGALNQIPVMILSTSSSERHMTNLYTAGRCRYYVKTPDFSLLSSIVAEILTFALACRPA